MSIAKVFKVALAGNPNAGKSSVFNLLTGERQKTGNFPGVTVEQHTGELTLGNIKLSIIDLPGTYSLYPNSLDERVVLEVLLNPSAPDFPDGLVYVADYQHLDRHLLLLTQLRDLGFPMLLALTMLDRVTTPQDAVFETLEARLGMPVIALNGRSGEGLPDLLEAIAQMAQAKILAPTAFITFSKEEQSLLLLAKDKGLATQNKADYHILQLAHHQGYLRFLSPDDRKNYAAAVEESGFVSVRHQIHETMRRYNKLDGLMRGIGHIKEKPASRTEQLDNVLTHAVWGPIIFLSIMFLVFQALFTVAIYPMDWIELGLGSFGQIVNQLLGKGLLSDFLVKGILAGLTGVLVFVPQIAILFLLMSLLEEVGYMARAVYLFDSLMQRFGLNGRSMVSLIGGGACAIPAIMSTRTISNNKERLITILVTPLISCSARIPVFILLLGFLIPENQRFGIFSVQALAFTGLYLMGIFAALLSALVFSKILKSEECSFLMLELPEYRAPHWKNVWLSVKQKVGAFLKEAGKTIIIISMVLWALTSFGPQDKMKAAVDNALRMARTEGYDTKKTENYIASEKMRHSYAGYIGRFVEPAIAPLGYDWKIGLALISSFAAREVFVGSMNTIYKAGADEKDYVRIREHLKRDVRPNGQPVFDVATVVSLLLFYLFALQCMGTLAVTHRETGTWKWPIVQFLFMGGLAWLSAFVAYQWLS